MQKMSRSSFDASNSFLLAWAWASRKEPVINLAPRRSEFLSGKSTVTIIECEHHEGIEEFAGRIISSAVD